MDRVQSLYRQIVINDGGVGVGLFTMRFRFYLPLYPAQASILLLLPETKRINLYGGIQR